jgi:hypothetical protein
VVLGSWERFKIPVVKNKGGIKHCALCVTFSSDGKAKSHFCDILLGNYSRYSILAINWFLKNAINKQTMITEQYHML